MHKYPKDLVQPLREIVTSTEGSNEDRSRKNVPLPKTDVLLETLLSEAFIASLQTEEGRQIVFRLMFAGNLEFQSSISVQMPNNRLLIFDEPRPYSHSEIIRLAPAADFRQFLICVQESVSKPQSLEIWGILNVGADWVRYLHHEIPSAITPPRFLTIRSSKPGELQFSSSGVNLLSLKNGVVRKDSPCAFFDPRIQRHFDHVLLELYETVNEKSDGPSWGLDQFDDYALRYEEYFNFLEIVLRNVEQRNHGGTILLVPDTCSTDEITQSKRFTLKYSSYLGNVWKMLVARLVERDLLTKLDEKIEPFNPGPYASELEQYRRVLHHHHGGMRELVDIAHSIAALTSVDGAVILTDKFRLFGFGAEVICENKEIAHVFDVTADISVPISAYGTRHRSAFRICSDWEDVVAFIISSDGGVKTIKQVNSKVLMWTQTCKSYYGL